MQSSADPSASTHSSTVTKVLVNASNTNVLEFFSLEEFGRVIVWNLLELS